MSPKFGPRNCSRIIVFVFTLLAMGLLTTGTLAQTTERISVAPDGTQGNFNSLSHSVSGDGRFVAFASIATNLVVGDTTHNIDAFVRDLVTDTTERVSIASDGTEANIPIGSTGSRLPVISADGRFVAFESDSTNLVPNDTNDAKDIFVHDRMTGTTERVSVASDGSEGTCPDCTFGGLSLKPAINADGRFVAFESLASNLVPGDTNGDGAIFDNADIFVHDRVTGMTERVSVASDGTQANERSHGPAAISADGRFVAFGSEATNLVAGDTNDARDIFIHDRQTGTTERVSIASDGAQAVLVCTLPDCPSGPDSGSLTLSGDGRFVGFESNASNLVADDTNDRSDFFLHDRETGTTERISVASDGSEGQVTQADISANGRFVAFLSSSPLVPNDTNFLQDAFVHDRVTGTTERVSVANDGSQPNEHSSAVAISGDGLTVAFGSSATNLVPVNTNNRSQSYVRIRASSGPTQVGEDTTVVPTATDNTGGGIDPTLATIKFDNVTDGGDTSITIDEEGAVPPSGLKLGDPPVVFDIDTTATFEGPVEVCFDYTSLAFGAENLLILTHFTDPDGAGPLPEQWVDVTTVLDTDLNVICGSVTSFSPFALMEPKDPVELLAGLSTLISELNARKGIINSLDAKLDAALKAWSDANENNNGAAVNSMEALVNAAQAQSGGQITVSEAEELIESAEEIIKVLTGDFF